MAKQVFPAYHAGLRRCGGSLSGSDVSEPKSLTGSRLSSASRGGGRYRALTKMKTWRPVGVKSQSSADGFCYLDLMSPLGKKQSATIGPNPSVYALLGMEADCFLKPDELKQFSIVGDSESAHVVRQGSGARFYDEIAAVASRSVPALRSPHTLWHSLQGVPTSGRSKFSGLTSVGALGELVSNSQGDYVAGGRVWKAQIGRSMIKIDMDTPHGREPIAKHCLSWLLRDLASAPSSFDCVQLIDEYSCYFSCSEHSSSVDFYRMCDELYERGFIQKLTGAGYAEFEWDYGMGKSDGFTGYRLALALLPILEGAGFGSADKLITQGLIRDLEVVARRWTYSGFGTRFQELVSIGRDASNLVALSSESKFQKDYVQDLLRDDADLSRKIILVPAVADRIAGDNLGVTSKGGLALLAILGCVATRVRMAAVDAVMKEFGMFL